MHYINLKKSKMTNNFLFIAGRYNNEYFYLPNFLVNDFKEQNVTFSF